jgi:Protein of unknown function (DUF3433)
MTENNEVPTSFPKRQAIENFTPAREPSCSQQAAGLKRPPSAGAPPIRGKEWRSWTLAIPWFILVIFIGLGIMIAIIVLEKMSTKNSGFVEVQIPTSIVHNQFISDSLWGQGMLWTTLPTFIMTVYGMMLGAVVAAASRRQPYIDLKRPEGAPAKRTIMLDYQASVIPMKWLLAIKNCHLVLLVAMVLSSLFSLAASPLTSSLFTEKTVNGNKTVEFAFADKLNGSLITQQTDMRPIFDLTAATRIYGGNDPAWTTDTYSFRPFVPVDNYSTTSGNWTAGTIAYSASLGCIVIPSSNMTVTTTPSANSTTVNIQAVDRGCQISGRITVSNASAEFIKTWDTQNCGRSHQYSRLGLAAAMPMNNASMPVTNFSVLSCVPTYTTTNGSLTAIAGVVGNPTMGNFDVFAADNTSFRESSDFWRHFEANLHTPFTFDVNGQLESTDLGNLIWQFAHQTSQGSELDPQVLVDATENIFTSVFALTCTTVAFQPTRAEEIFSGSVSTSTSRLFVASKIAYALVTLLAAVVLSMLFTLIYTIKTTSILFEEPVGLLSSAGILAQSDVNGFTDTLRRMSWFDGRVTNWAEHSNLPNNRFGVVGEGPREQRIVSMRGSGEDKGRDNQRKQTTVNPEDPEKGAGPLVWTWRLETEKPFWKKWWDRMRRA